MELKYLINVEKPGLMIVVKGITVRTPCVISIYTEEEYKELTAYLHRSKYPFFIESITPNESDVILKEVSETVKKNRVNKKEEIVSDEL